LLPTVGDLNVQALKRSTAKVTNSYKFLFILAILDYLNDTGFQSSQASLQDISERMLTSAWYRHSVFKLSFGKQDMISKTLGELSILPRSLKRKDVLQELSGMNKTQEIMRYVPYRFLRSFFEQELVGLSDGLVNEAVAKLADQRFDTTKPVYRFSADRKYVEFHPDWLKYFKVNYGVVEGWAYWEWLQYMQSKNPHVPAISNKLQSPNERTSIPVQHVAHWRTILKAYPQLRCIYSNQTLQPFALDHFLPWSFVAHHQVWILIPTVTSVNSKKSNSLPSLTYMEPFVRFQQEGLKCARALLGRKAWSNHAECFMYDLRLDDERSLLDYEKLGAAYQATLRPLRAIAERQRFASGWAYSG